MADPEVTFPDFIDKVVDFPGPTPDESTSYELLTPITNFMSCHDGTPAEARVLFTCKRLTGPASDETFIMKVKVQEPGVSPTPATPHPGPSTTTAAELAALHRFTAAANPHTPRLVASRNAVQGPKGPLPGGYVTYTAMTRVPGRTLYELGFWGTLDEAERGRVVEAFLPALRSIRALGIEPVDRGLRNVLWEPETRTCSIIDFELWQEDPDMCIKDETRELQRWGMAPMPRVRDFYEIWNMHMR